MLPEISRFNLAPVDELRNLLRGRVNMRLLRSMTEPEDNLRKPLTPTRETSLQDSAEAVLVRLLFCRSAESYEIVRQALGSELTWGMVVSGVLVGEDNLVFPFHLRIVEGLFLISDFLGDHPDAVMGAGETTAILYRAGRPESRIGKALDLGCGAGTIALLLASDSDFVVGTDVNRRAVEIARFNAALNDIRNSDFRAGDMYQPVADEQFDLILSQPPYYPNRRDGSDEVYLHGGEFGDELSHRVVAGLPRHLTASGQAILFTSWPEGRQADCPEGFQALELTTNRREVHGTRQSLNIFRRADPSWLARASVPADSWGFVRPKRIRQMFDAEMLLSHPNALFQSALRIPPGTRILEEGDQVILQGTPESLIGMAPIDQATWTMIQAVDRVTAAGLANPDPTRLAEAVRRGFLIPAEALC